MEEAVQEAEDPGLVTKYGSSCDELRWSELFNCLLETLRLAPAGCYKEALRDFAAWDLAPATQASLRGAKVPQVPGPAEVPQVPGPAVLTLKKIQGNAGLKTQAF